MKFLIPFMALFLVSCMELPEIPESIDVNHNFEITAEDVARAVEVLTPIAEFGAGRWNVHAARCRTGRGRVV